MKTNIEIIHAKNTRDLRTFRKFAFELYKGDNGWNASSLFMMDIFLEKRDSFCKEAVLSPVMARKKRNILAQCILIYHPGLPVVQVAFFEALQGQEKAVNLLLEEARALAKQKDCHEVVVGLNGHLAYGVGIMTDGWGKPASFDTLYHKPYFADYFRDQGMREFTLSTYRFDPEEINNRYGKKARAYRQFTFRVMDPGRWREEMELFGDLANRCLNHTRYYFERPPHQLYELLQNMKFFMKPEYLIFAMKDRKEVGFIFWHPDFSEVLPRGRSCTIAGFGLRYLVRMKSISTVKVNAIGLLPRVRRTGAAMGLFMTALGHTNKRYSKGETNFVWDCNRESRLFNLSMNGKADRRYSVFSEKLKGEHA